ncbi:carotenoid 1,2-hydratase [Aureimonas sp. SA4125]|uniref:hydratase n=1 Tax=Aureimonas sp. SA4125 TaxID=2826993 RepID=UPI001CC39C9F|nr:hydratase [Aureimonas sp. SA4125]BDA85238.1 carotenoid 1,2-hydratase [Aureimonas sp. SA4125]
MPIPRRLRGRITVEPGPIFSESFGLDEARRHLWRPIAPCGRAEVAFDRPALGWQGSAYIDMNAGAEPLEAGFHRWGWAREDGAGTTRIRYDVVARSGERRRLALEYGADGSARPIEPAPLHRLPSTGWRVGREAGAEGGTPPRVLRTLEDTPFYSRSMLGCAGDGGERRAIHETVDLDRFATRWVQTLLPFRMPRWTRGATPLLGSP